MTAADIETLGLLILLAVCAIPFAVAAYYGNKGLGGL
jgi:hypothetical protein